MTPSTRRLAGLLLGSLLFVASLFVSGTQFRNADHRGWAGVSFFPQIPKEKQSRKTPKKAPFGIKFGEVFMLIPGAPAERAGMKAGDTVLRVNNVSTADWEAIEELDKRVKRGDAVVYHVRRKGKELDVPVRFASPVRSWLYIPSLTIGLLVSLIFIAIGSAIFWRRSDDRRVRVFYAMTVAASVYLSASAVMQASNPSMRGITSQVAMAMLPQLFVFLAAVVLFAPLLLHLALVFPKPRPILTRRPEILRWVYGPEIILGITFTWAFVTETQYPHTRAFSGLLVAGVIAAIAANTALLLQVYREGAGALRRHALTTQLALATTLNVISVFAAVQGHDTVFLVLFSTIGALCFGAIFTFPIATIVALYRSYRESGVEEKRQVKWPLWATIVVIVTRGIVAVVGSVIGFAMLMTTHRFMSGITMQVLGSLPYLLYVLIPISFAFAIAKYRLMNIDLIIRRTVLYAILTAVVFVIYGGLVASVGTMLVRFAGVQNQTMVIASTIVVALVAVPLRNRLQTLVDRNVFRERVSYPLALRTISDAVSRAAAREELLRITAEQLQQALQSRFVLIVMRSDQHFVATAKVGVADEVLGTFRVSAAGVDLSRPLDPERDPLPPDLAQRLRRLGATLIVPMRAQRASVGFIALGAKLSNEPFDGDDIQFVESAASQVAFALETSRLKNEEEDFDQARAMQQVLLPKSLPQLDGFRLAGMWQPARSVGGDYYDAITLGPGKAAICIADVAGKGMPAALLMAGLQATVKATASMEMSPSRLCERVRQVVSHNLTGGTFITFFYAVLDANARTLTYCNAGHNPPLLVRAHGDVESLATGGTVLGRLFAGNPYAEATVALHSGDRVVLFTDGVTEARRGEDDDFGEERLVDVIKSHPAATADELQEHIVEAITTFTSGSFGDDVTLVVIAAS